MTSGLRPLLAAARGSSGLNSCALFAFSIAMLLATGCAPSALSAARQKLAAGQYPAARQELVALEQHESDLTKEERRELHDDLCLSDFMIGEPTYPLSEQRRECAQASKAAGSRSEQFVEKIDASIRSSAADKVAVALKNGDLGDAEQAALAYVDTPGDDPRVLASWSNRMWELVAEQDQRAAPRRKKEIAAAIAEVRKQHATTKSASKSDFLKWVAKEGTVSGKPMLSGVALAENHLDLQVRSADVRVASLNLDKFAEMNDAMVVRCRCDGRTNVAIAETNFPLYLVRLDPETRRSEVLILPHQQ